MTLAIYLSGQHLGIWEGWLKGVRGIIHINNPVSLCAGLFGPQRCPIRWGEPRMPRKELSDT